MKYQCLLCQCGSCKLTDEEIDEGCDNPNCINCDGTHICKDCERYIK